MQKHIVFFCLIVCLVFLALCGCEKNVAVEVKIPPENKNMVELSTAVYSYAELVDISNYPGNINEINKRYPIECVRKIDNTFRVTYRGENHIVILTYNNDGTKILSSVQNCTLCLDTFASIGVGMPIEDVLHIDPNGSYVFLYAGRNDFPRVSRHYTKDGYLFEISYDDNNLVNDITVSLI